MFNIDFYLYIGLPGLFIGLAIVGLMFCKKPDTEYLKDILALALVAVMSMFVGQVVTYMDKETNATTDSRKIWLPSRLTPEDWI